MGRTVPLLVALLALAAAGGCLSTPGGSEEPAENVTVGYAVESGDVPDEIASATLTAQVVFVENGGDFGPCLRDTYYGPYKPTPTPIGEPDGDCRRSQNVTVDLTAPDGTQTLTATAPERFDAGHALVVTEVSATDDNGTAISRLKGIGGLRANVVEGLPGDRYTVEFGIDSAETSVYDYYVVTEENESSR